MEKSEVQAASKAFKEDKIATYLCSNSISQQFYRSNKEELHKLAQEYLNKTYFKKHYSADFGFGFLFYYLDITLERSHKKHIRIKFLEWIIRTKL